MSSEDCIPDHIQDDPKRVVANILRADSIEASVNMSLPCYQVEASFNAPYRPQRGGYSREVAVSAAGYLNLFLFAQGVRNTNAPREHYPPTEKQGGVKCYGLELWDSCSRADEESQCEHGNARY